MSQDDLNNLDPHTDKTISVSRRTFNAAVSNQDSPQSEEKNASIVGHEGELILVIRGMVERIMIRQDSEIKLGRFEPPGSNELDLTPYGAADRGVSRFHARIHFESNQLFITDMDSTNGTYIGGIKLDAHTPTVLHKGDELVIGRLSMQVMFS